MKRDYDSISKILLEFKRIENEFDLSDLDDKFKDSLMRIKEELEDIVLIKEVEKKVTEEVIDKDKEYLHEIICSRDIRLRKLEQENMRLKSRLSDTSVTKSNMLNKIDDDSYISFIFGFGMNMDNNKEYLYMGIHQRLPETVSLIPLETDQKKVSMMKKKYNDKLSLNIIKEYSDKITEKANKFLLSQGLGLETRQERIERERKEGYKRYNNPNTF